MPPTAGTVRELSAAGHAPLEEVVTGNADEPSRELDVQAKLSQAHQHGQVRAREGERHTRQGLPEGQSESFQPWETSTPPGSPPRRPAPPPA